MKTMSLVLGLFFSISAFADGSVLGKWKTIDDETGKEKSIVEITQDGDVVSGRIIELINPEKENPLCEKCKGDKFNQPIKGLQLLWGFKETKKGEEWSGGHILDPDNGKIYKCYLRPKDGGQKLEVRGFIGFSLLGRTQVWLKQN